MTYNNETGMNEFDTWSSRAQWFVDLDGNCYVIPPPDIVTEIYEAPDNIICDALTAFCREHPGSAIPEDFANTYALFPIPKEYQRFNVMVGYYIADPFFQKQEYSLWRESIINPLFG